MADQFGSQGGFEGIGKATTQFKEGTGVFKTAVGEWTFGVLAVSKILAPSVDKLKTAGDTLLRLTGVLRGLGDAFTSAKLIDIVADLSSSMYHTKKDLQRTFGLFGEDNNKILESIRVQSQLTNQYGIRMKENIESFKALYSQFRTTNFDLGLVSATSKISALYGLTEDSAAEIAFSLNKYAGMGEGGIGNFMEGVSLSAAQAGLSSYDIASNMASSAKYMYRFTLDTKKGGDNFKRMLVYSTKIGQTVGEMTTAMDEFRTIPGAIQGSVTASLAGLNIGATELMVSARGEDKTVLYGRIMDHLSKMTDKQGRLSNIGYDMATQLGPMINMSNEEIQRALVIMNAPLSDLGKSYIANDQRLAKQQDIMTKLENTMYNMFNVIQPAANTLLSILEWVTDHTKTTKALLLGSAAFWAWSKAGGTIKSVAGGISKWGGMSGSLAALRDKGYGGGMGKAGTMGRFKYMMGLGGVEGTGGANRRGRGPNIPGGGRGRGGVPSGPPRRPDGTFGTGLSPKQMAAQSKQMLAGAVGMLAFAGAMWILSKALNNFNTVDWDSVKKAGLVMVGFSLSMIGIGYTLKANYQSLLALSVAMVAVGVGMMGIGVAAKLLGETDLVNVGAGLIALSAGMLALMGVGALMVASGGLGAVFAGVGVASLVVTLMAIGEAALKYAAPIETMANAMAVLAAAMLALTEVGPVDVNFDADKKSLNNLERGSLLLAGTNAAAKSETIDNTITLNVDGEKLLRILHKSPAVRGA